MSPRGTPAAFRGSWKILEMEMWARDYIDLVVPGHVTFEPQAMGRFQFGTVVGWMDCRFSRREGLPRVEFSWQGMSDTDEACGRGEAVLAGERLEGRLFIHCGDDSAFVAEKSTEAFAVRAAPRRRKRAARRRRWRRRAGEARP